MPKGVKFFRALREGVRSFVRSGWLAVSAVLTTALALFVIGLAGIQAITAQSILRNLEDKMNITVSFNGNADEERILAIKKELEKYREVKSVEYTSEEQALEKLRNRSRAVGNSTVIEQALEEIDGNPLPASLTIRAASPDDYAVINRSLETASFKDDIFRINYRENQDVINRLNSVKKEVVRQGSILGIILLAVAFLVTFNTIRLTMFTRREDFEVMRLVGASNLSLRTPSVVEGILYGVSASVLSMVFLYLFLAFQRNNPFLNGDSSGSGLMGSFVSNIALISAILFSLGVFIGALSGFLAVRRFLKI